MSFWIRGLGRLGFFGASVVAIWFFIFGVFRCFCCVLGVFCAFGDFWYVFDDVVAFSVIFAVCLVIFVRCS